jgi:hypothetical protein
MRVNKGQFDLRAMLLQLKALPFRAGRRLEALWVSR